MNHISPMKHTASAPQLRGLVLDCDGVLFDSKASNTAYYNHIRHAVHLPSLTEEEAAYSHMASSDEAIEHIIPDDLMEEAQRVRQTIRYRDLFMPMMQPAPYMFRFLQNMQAAGLPLALFTNRSDSVHEVLRHFDIAPYFSPVMTISQVEPKPSPQGLVKIAAIWNVPTSSIIFMGDSPVDQQAAAAAGVPFWGYGNPSLTAARHISDFKELDTIIKSMLL